MRLRFGAGLMACRLCNRTHIDGAHAVSVLLMKAPGTNAIRHVVFYVTKLADATANREVFGLFVYTSGLRPANILTYAVTPSLTQAVCVNVVVPNAINAPVPS